jgi:alkylhydroperoxidase/carboxymuconolactone decarboxylase family protein YurZ
MFDSGARERATKTRNGYFGEEYVTEAREGASEFFGPVMDFVTDLAWGELWPRDGADLRIRSTATLAILATLGRELEFKLHVAVALENGLTREEVREILLHVCVYAGIPTGRTAAEWADGVLAGLDD